jgi:hypothetical protein
MVMSFSITTNFMVLVTRKHRNISIKEKSGYHQYCGNDARGLPPSSWFWLLENTEIYLENTVI